ncbi:MAG: caspase family protein, partial [Saprospiraceae bacterium]|nr:caspase family protein [Saprospiraceae bacterium]
MTKRGSIRVKPKNNGKGKDPFGKTNHLLAIGINNYPETIGKLNNAVRDAEEFEKILKTYYGFDHTRCLINEEATQEGIIAAFDQLITELTEDDNLVVYFAGHGQLVHRKGYWIPYDAVQDKRHTYLANYEVLALMSDVKAHHVLMIVDACFSGALLSHERSAAAERFYEMPSRWVMTSGQIEPVGDGVKGEYSPFAKSLFTQLKCYPKDLLSISQLWVNVREGVVDNGDQVPNCQPVRNVGHQNGEFYFIKPNAAESPSPLPSSVEEIVARGPVSEIEVPEEPVSDLEIITSEDLKKAMKKELINGNSEAALQLSLEHLNDTSDYTNIAILRMGNLRRLERQIIEGVALNDTQQRA